MTKITICLIILFTAQISQADTLLKLKDGTAYVWEKDSIFAKGSALCTRKAIGEYCVPKSDIVLKKEVPDGTDPSEYSTGSAAAFQSQSDSLWASQYDEKAEKEKKSRDAADDRKRERQRKQDERYYGKEKADQMRMQGNSVR